MNCWICGTSGAATREHRAKASDIKHLLGTPSQKRPFYFRASAGPGVPPRRNLRIGGLQSNALKYTHRICLACNSARTQPHDRAWEHAAAKLRPMVPQLLEQGSFSAESLFPYIKRRGMLNLHLYFAKLFGCQIVEGGIAIDLAPFASAILEGRPHPNLFLAFGHFPGMPFVVVGGSDVQVALLNERVVFASWFYQVGDLCVNAMYAGHGEQRQGLEKAWHPRQGCKRLSFSTFGE